MAQGAMAAGDLLPNLQTFKPYDMRITTESGKKLLRFSNEVPNNAKGAMEVRPKTGEDCNGNGNVDDDRAAYQRIYQDDNSDGKFTRSIDRTYRLVKAGCMVFHPAHNHWHFNDFADYVLKNDETGAVESTSTKVSFCMIDINRPFPSLLGSPNSAYYTQCSQTAPMGISVGWSDVYTWDLSGQWVDVTNVDRTRRGYHCLVSTADPDNKLLETNNADNTGKVRIAISSTGVVKISGYGCQHG